VDARNNNRQTPLHLLVAQDCFPRYIAVQLLAAKAPIDVILFLSLCVCLSCWALVFLLSLHSQQKHVFVAVCIVFDVCLWEEAFLPLCFLCEFDFLFCFAQNRHICLLFSSPQAADVDRETPLATALGGGRRAAACFL
jgi:hypothetical protein